MFFHKKINAEEIIKSVYQTNRVQRYASFLLGIFIVAIAYNMFVLPSDVVYGVGGIAVILKKLFGLSPFIIILGSSILLLLLSYVMLGKEKTATSIVGSFLYPIFVKLTEFIPKYLHLEEADPLLIVVVGAVATGFGLGLIFKAGFTTGGTDILNQIVAKYGKTSMGNAMLFTDGLIIVLSGFVFGIIKVIYSLLSLYIISVMSDKVIIGISQSKAFYVITEHEADVKKFVLKHLSHGVTIFDVRGGYTGNHQKMIMFIVPTKEYYLAKESITKIDPEAFFVVTDAYEVSGVE